MYVHASGNARLYTIIYETHTYTVTDRNVK